MVGFSSINGSINAMFSIDHSNDIHHQMLPRFMEFYRKGFGQVSDPASSRVEEIYPEIKICVAIPEIFD